MACKAEEESGLTPADDENAARRKINRKDIYFLMEEQYNYGAKHLPSPSDIVSFEVNSL